MSEDTFDALLTELVGPEASEDPATPSDRFTVVRRLGEGGFGSVYEAMDLRDRRRVALKMLRRANPDALMRFKREFRSLADVTDPNLVQLWELIQHGNQWMLVMELVDGRPFDRWVAAHPDVLRPAFGQLARAVAALHRAGKLHRDIKPSNVLVEDGGRVVVLDFGLVRELDHDDSTEVAGTPDFMAPEQCAGGPLSPAADWYALGVMLYQALAGGLPFEGSKPARIRAKQQVDAPGLPTDAPADLARLCAALLSRDPWRRPTAAEILAAFEVEEPRADTEQERPFVGRDAQLAALRRALDEVRSGRAVTAFVRGVSGVGKTRLVGRFLRGLGSDVLVLSARCYEHESMRYKAVDGLVDMLCAYLKRLPTAQAAALMPRHIHQLARLFPVLQDVDAIGAVPRPQPVGHAERERQRLAFAALKELLGRLADKQCLLVYVDDLQWGEVDSARLLAEVLTPPEAPRMLALFSHRVEAAADSPCLRELRRLGAGNERIVELEPLAANQALELARELLPDAAAAVTQSLAEESDGHPYFLEQLARRTAEGLAGPVTLDDLIGERLVALSEPERRLLDVVALAGQPIEQRAATRAAQTSGSGPIDSLRTQALVRTQGLQPDARIESYHDRVRGPAAHRLEPAEATRLHLAIATALEAATPHNAEALAVHFRAGGAPDRAAPYAEQAADAAAGALAFDHAAELYQVALELRAGDGKRARTLGVKLAEAHSNAGNSPAAADAFLAAAGVAPEDESITLRTRAVRELLFSGHYERGFGVLEPLMRRLHMRRPKTRAGHMASIVYLAARLRMRGLDFERRAAGEVPQGELARIDLCASGALGLHFYDLFSSVRFALLGSLYALRCGEPGRVALGLTGYALYRAATDVADGRAIVQRAERIARPLSDRRPIAWVLLAKGAVHVFTADWAAALSRYDEGLQHVLEHCPGEYGLASMYRQFTRYSLYRLGRLREADARDAEPLRTARACGDEMTERHIDLWSVHGMLARDDLEGAQSCVDRWRDKALWPMALVEQAGFAILVALYAGRAGAAARAWARLRGTGVVRMLSLNVFYVIEAAWGESVAKLASWSGDHAALGRITRRARRLRQIDNGFGRGVRAAALAGVQWRRGDLEGAAQLFDEAAGGYDEVGMRLFSAACRRRRGQLLGGDAGDTLIRASEAVMGEEGIVNPEAYSNCYAPHPNLRDK